MKISNNYNQNSRPVGFNAEGASFVNKVTGLSENVINACMTNARGHFSAGDVFVLEKTSPDDAKYVLGQLGLRSAGEVKPLLYRGKIFLGTNNNGTIKSLPGLEDVVADNMINLHKDAKSLEFIAG